MNHIDLENIGADPEAIRKSRRITSIAKTYTKEVADERAAIDQALKAGLTLSTHTLISAGYADNAKAAFSELNQKDN